MEERDFCQVEVLFKDRLKELTPDALVLEVIPTAPILAEGRGLGPSILPAESAQLGGFIIVRGSEISRRIIIKRPGKNNN